MTQTLGTLENLHARIGRMIAEAREGHGLDPEALWAEGERLKAMSDMVAKDIAE